MSFYVPPKRDRAFFLFITVFIAHIAIGLFLGSEIYSNKKATKTKAIAVHFQEAPKKPEPPAPKPPNPRTPPKVKKEPPPTKKPSKKKPKEKRQKIAKKPAPKKKEDPIRKAALARLKASLEELDEEYGAPDEPQARPNLALRPMEDLEAENLPTMEAVKANSSYESSLVAYLQTLMKLPEYGDVQIQLTLARTGEVKSLVILKTESEKNALRVKTLLPGIVFKDFGEFFPGESQRRFTITLSSDF